MRPSGMRSRAPALVAVVVFAVAVALVAVVAGGGGDGRLVKLPAGASAGAASNEAAAAADAMSTRSGLLYPMLVDYKVEGTLPELASKAPAYRLGSATTAAAVARLAASLDLAGDVQADPTGWVVTDGDLQLRVESAAGLPWYVGAVCMDVAVSSEEGVSSSCAVAVDTPMPLPVEEPQASGGSTGRATAGCGPAVDCASPPSPDCGDPTVKCVPPEAVKGCEPGTVCTDPAPPTAPTCPDGAKCATEIAIAPACAPDQPCEVPAPEPVEPPARPADLPSEVEARTLAIAAFERLGVGTGGMVVEDGWTSWYVRVEATVDGVEAIGMGTSLTIGPKGAITGGNGFLAVPERIGDYPLVGVKAGLERLTAGVAVGGAGAVDLGAPAPEPHAAGAIEPAPADCGDPTASCLTGPVDTTPIVQTITGARLGLMFHGGALVPVYVFDLADGGSIPVVAVTDEWLEKEPAGVGD